jgi:hypothetical protein
MIEAFELAVRRIQTLRQQGLAGIRKRANVTVRKNRLRCLDIADCSDAVRDGIEARRKE